MNKRLRLQSNLADDAKIFDEYKRFVLSSSFDPHHLEGNNAELAYLALGLAGETGEFVDEVKKCVRESGYAVGLMAEFGDTPHYEKLVDELGDVLWYIERLMHVLEVTRKEVAVRNTYKLHTRYPEYKWPFTDPFMTQINVKELIDGEDDDG